TDTWCISLGTKLAWSKQPLPLAGTAWSCPPVRITCAMANPPNACYTDQHCPRLQKCCPSFCGRRCRSRPPAIPISYG
ncbi:ELAF protein, partial [Crypturellus soui]|nr:ELAF protein [Crypturellus soui]